MVEASPKYSDYLALKDYVVLNTDEGLLYFKSSVGKFNKYYLTKVWNPCERRLTWQEFQEHWGSIQKMLQMNAIRAM